MEYSNEPNNEPRGLLNDHYEERSNVTIPEVVASSTTSWDNGELALHPPHDEVKKATPLNDDNRLLSKPACGKGFEGGAERRTGVYLSVHEDSSTAPTYKSPAQVGFGKKSNINITPLALLAYLSSIKEFELYYYLFNQVSIVNIDNPKLEISREGADKSLNNRLAEILFTWTGTKWNVIITDASGEPSLKEKMKAKFMESEEWKMLQEHSSGTILTDIILD